MITLGWVRFSKKYWYNYIIVRFIVFQNPFKIQYFSTLHENLAPLGGDMHYEWRCTLYHILFSLCQKKMGPCFEKRTLLLANLQKSFNYAFFERRLHGGNMQQTIVICISDLVRARSSNIMTLIINENRYLRSSISKNCFIIQSLKCTEIT